MNKKCPNCGSYKTNSNKNAWKPLLLLGLATSWIFGIGLIFIVAAVIYFIYSRFIAEVNNCQDCKAKFS